jgi:hypothetical protein
VVRRDQEDDEPNPKNGIERHIQTIVTSITLALLLWTGMTLVDLRDRLARMEEKNVNLQSLILNFTGDRFTGSDWKREKEVIEERFQRLERDMERRHTETPLNGRR